MKTKVLLLALLSGFIFTLSAQEYQPQIGYSTEPGYKTNFMKNKAGDNWFISAGAGMSILYGDQNSKADFKNRLNVNPNFSFGKWFNPYLGLRFAATGGVLHGFEGDNAQFMQHNKYVMAHVDFMWDVINFWGRYDEKRVFRLIPWVGVGYAQRFKTSESNGSIPRTESPSINFGLLTAFRLSERLDLNIEAQGAFLVEEWNRVQMHHLLDGIGQLNIGLTVKLGKTNFEVLQPMDYALLNDLNSQINALRAENAELSKRPVSCPDCEEVITTITNTYADNAVYFQINSAKIRKDQEIQIYNTAQFIKDTNTPITVVGFADKETGTSTYNMQLSEKRAKAVAKELTEKYGVPSSLITVQWKGSDVQPYDKEHYKWNRVVIMSAAE